MVLPIYTHQELMKTLGSSRFQGGVAGYSPMDNLSAPANEGQPPWALGFVPTMGALHEGHVSLAREAKKSCHKVVASIFVNPLQFGPKEDFGKYPRTLDDDLRLLDEAGVDFVFLPTPAVMYPEGFQTYLYNRQMSLDLCGHSRPQHFEGVLTVVLKLFMLVGPTAAFFGKKDYQQWRLIEKMVEDLALPIRVIGCETVRESDGLAKSSRNRYLTPDERSRAAVIYTALQAAKSQYQSGERRSKNLVMAAQQVLSQCPELQLEYVSLRLQKSLMPVAEHLDENHEPMVMLVAARLGGTRLIDNLELS